MADGSKKDATVKDTVVEGEKKEEEKPAVVEEVLSIEDGQSNLCSKMPVAYVFRDGADTR